MKKMFREVFFDGKNRLVSVEDLLKENEELLEKLDELKNKLDIAVKTLEEYAEEENWDDCSTGDFGSIPTLWFKSAYKKKHFGYNEAKEALGQIKDVK